MSGLTAPPNQPPGLLSIEGSAGVADFSAEMELEERGSLNIEEPETGLGRDSIDAPEEALSPAGSCNSSSLSPADLEHMGDAESKLREGQFLQRSKLRPPKPNLTSYKPESLAQALSLSQQPTSQKQLNIFKKSNIINNNSNKLNQQHNLTPSTGKSPLQAVASTGAPSNGKSSAGVSGKVTDPQQMHVCRLCDKLLSSSSSLDRHMLTHSGIRPFVCKRCNMTFTTNGNMHRHMRTHLHKDSLARQQQEQQLKSLIASSNQINSALAATPTTPTTNSGADNQPSSFQAGNRAAAAALAAAAAAATSSTKTTTTINNNHSAAPALATVCSAGSAAALASAAAKFNPLSHLTQSLLAAGAGHQQHQQHHHLQPQLQTINQQHHQQILVNDYLMPLSSPLAAAAAAAAAASASSKGPVGGLNQATSTSATGNNFSALFAAAATDPLSLLAAQQGLTEPDQLSSVTAFLNQQLAAALKQQHSSNTRRSHQTSNEMHLPHNHANQNQNISSGRQIAANLPDENNSFLRNQQQQPQQRDLESLMLRLGQGPLSSNLDHQRQRFGLESVKAVMLAAAAAASAVSSQQQQQQQHQQQLQQQNLLLDAGNNLLMESHGQMLNQNEQQQQNFVRSIRGKPRKQVNPRSSRQEPSSTQLKLECDVEIDSGAEEMRSSDFRRQAPAFMENMHSEHEGSMSSIGDSTSNFNEAQPSTMKLGNFLRSTNEFGGDLDANMDDERDDDRDDGDQEENGHSSSSRDSLSKLVPSNGCPAPIKWTLEEDFNNNNNNNNNINNNDHDLDNLDQDDQVDPFISSRVENPDDDDVDNVFDDDDDDDNEDDDDLATVSHQTSLDTAGGSDNHQELLTNPLTSIDNDEIIEDISQSYVKTANPNATRKGGKRNRHCYKCKLCKYSSVDRCTLVRHLRIHSGERPYICGICRYAFTTKANCERHVKKRHKKQYNSLGGAGGGGVKGSNGGGRSLIITDHSNHQTIPVKVNPVAAQTISQTLQRIQEKQEQASSTTLIINNNNISSNNNNNNSSSSSSINNINNPSSTTANSTTTNTTTNTSTTNITQCNSRKIDNLFFNDDVSQALDLSFKLQK